MYRTLISRMRALGARRVTLRQLALFILAPLLVVLTSASSCGGGSHSTSDKETNLTQNAYGRLAAAQPAHVMSYSPTRATLNFWIDTWGKDPNKTSYVYLQSANGDLLGYYVLKGLPVSYCTALTPPTRFVNPGGSGDHPNAQVPAASADGAYYSGSDCNRYYGKDATTGAYVEYTAGLGINVLLYDEPLANHPGVQPLGPTKIK